MCNYADCDEVDNRFDNTCEIIRQETGSITSVIFIYR